MKKLVVVRSFKVAILQTRVPWLPVSAIGFSPMVRLNPVENESVSKGIDVQYRAILTGGAPKTLKFLIDDTKERARKEGRSIKYGT
jgi:hypothetical protein